MLSKAICSPGMPSARRASSRATGRGGASGSGSGRPRLTKRRVSLNSAPYSRMLHTASAIDGPSQKT
jgi:hypothetical protein